MVGEDVARVAWWEGLGGRDGKCKAVERTEEDSDTYELQKCSKANRFHDRSLLGYFRSTAWIRRWW
jgi:hypothetical protein